MEPDQAVVQQNGIGRLRVGIERGIGGELAESQVAANRIIGLWTRSEHSQTRGAMKATLK